MDHGKHYNALDRQWAKIEKRMLNPSGLCSLLHGARCAGKRWNHRSNSWGVCDCIVSRKRLGCASDLIKRKEWRGSVVTVETVDGQAREVVTHPSGAVVRFNP